MPRGKKGSRNFDAELSALDAKIERCKTQISELEEKKQRLLEDQRSAEMKEVYSTMKRKGLTPKELLDFMDKT